MILFMSPLFEPPLSGINLNKMHLNKPYAGDGCVFKELHFSPTKEMIAFFFLPVGRDPFVQYFPANSFFCKDEPEMQGARIHSLIPPPCLSWEWEETRVSWPCICPGTKDGLGQMCVADLCQGAPRWCWVWLGLESMLAWQRGLHLGELLRIPGGYSLSGGIQERCRAVLRGCRMTIEPHMGT